MFTQEEKKVVDSFHLLTSKPVAYVLNVDEDSIAEGNNHTNAVAEYLQEKYGDKSQDMSVRLCSVLEETAISMDDEARAEFFELAEVEESGLKQVSRLASRLLDIQCYYTVGPKEARSWLITRGSTAQEAAGKIHSDMERGFIAAEVIPCADFIEHGGDKGAKAAGKHSLLGKTYIMNDGDIAEFRFAV